ncbi:MAG: ribokinase [Parcubacteria bacterium C7867-005]|nr:MAG: ribokinase [Parcubacteria bacterium C7867-005]
MKEYDFIAIGDIVTDAFINLDEKFEKVEGVTGHPGYNLCIPFGDKIPYESVEIVRAVGNSANAAVSAARLGLKSALSSNIGDDTNGKECLETLEKEHVATEFVKVNQGKITNYHYVLWYGDDRTILVKHQNYDHLLPNFGSPKWLYLSSLGEHTLEYHKEIAEYLKQHPEVSLAFQPGTYQMMFGKEALKDIYNQTKILFCNIEEAGRILGITTLGTEELLKRMFELGPKIIVLTDGAKGAYAYDGKEMWFVPPYPDIAPPVERTGAGDAFASTTVSALAMGKDLPTALSWGAINSMSVVQEVGAQKGLLGKEKIENYLASAPAEFKARKLN